jgi:hypothetical protein
LLETKSTRFGERLAMDLGYFTSLDAHGRNRSRVLLAEPNSSNYIRVHNFRITQRVYSE